MLELCQEHLVITVGAPATPWVCVCVWVYACVHVCVCACTQAHTCAAANACMPGILLLATGISLGGTFPNSRQSHHCLGKVCKRAWSGTYCPFHAPKKTEGVGLYPVLQVSKLGQGVGGLLGTVTLRKVLWSAWGIDQAPKELQCQYPVTKLQKPRNIGTTGALLECCMISLQESHPGLCLAPVSTWCVLEGSAWAGSRGSGTLTAPRTLGFFSLTHALF